MDIMPIDPDSTTVDPAEQFSAMYTAHRRLVAAIVARRLRSDHRDLVEDLVQEVYLQLWVHLAAGRVVESETGLLGTIARRTVADHYRKRSSAELVADFGDGHRLPPVASAEDIATVRLVAAELLADVASGPTPLVLGPQVDGLMALAVAA